MTGWLWRIIVRKARRDAAHDPAGWVELGWYAGHFDADVDRALLESAGVPVLVQSSATGLFGPGFAGPTAEGIRIYVPADRLEFARALLSGGDAGG